MTHFRLPAAAGRLVTALALTLSASAAMAGPAIQHWVAETGARVFFVPGDTLPMLDVRVDFAAAANLDAMVPNTGDHVQSAGGADLP